MRGYHLKFMLNDLYVFMACSRLWHLPSTFMFWGPSPLCLACAMSNCHEALPDGQHFEQRCRSTSKLKVRWFPGIARNQVKGLLRQAQSQ